VFPKAAPRIPPLGMHRAHVIRGLHEAAREAGLDAADLLEEAGLARDLLQDPDHLVPYSSTCQLLHAAAEQSGFDHFGLQVGRRSGLGTLGLVDIFARTCDTAGEGLACVVEHLNLTSGVSMIWLSEVESHAVVRYALAAPTSMPTRQYYDAAMAILWNLVRDLCGDRWTPTEVRFAHREPVHLRAFRSFFRAPVRFDCPEYLIVFDACWLRHLLPSANALLRMRLAKEVDRIRRALVADTTPMTRRLIRKLLAVDQCTIEHVARLLGAHRRTLDRRLDAEGTSFSAELESVRRQVARELLLDTDLSIGEIAAALSYGNVSSFCTAFHRWHGTTATAFRANRRNNDVRGDEALA
jgi:AraC-like DNA-binding protein